MNPIILNKICSDVRGYCPWLTVWYRTGSLVGWWCDVCVISYLHPLSLPPHFICWHIAYIKRNMQAGSTIIYSSNRGLLWNSHCWQQVTCGGHQLFFYIIWWITKYYLNIKIACCIFCYLFFYFHNFYEAVKFIKKGIFFLFNEKELWLSFFLNYV